MNNIKAVCFDLDGVYFTPESFKRFKKDISNGISEDQVSQVLAKSDQMLSFKRGELTENEYWDYVRKELNISLTNQDIFDLLQNAYERNAEIVDIVRLVKESGIKTCICSNNFETRVRELDKKFNFLKDFDVKIFSYKVGFLKPDKRIFEELIKVTNVNPNEIIYSDDSPDKIIGAKELGINTFLFENTHSFILKLKENGVIQQNDNSN